MAVDLLQDGMHQVEIEDQGLEDLGQDNMDQIELVPTIVTKAKIQIIALDRGDMEIRLTQISQCQVI